MLKRTIVFSNPYHLKTRHHQLVVCDKETGEEQQLPIEDLGYVIFEHPAITFTQNTVRELSDNNTAVVFCNDKHMPHSMLFNLEGNYEQNERFHHQINASVPLKKQLWQQTIKAKIRNQAALLDQTQTDGTPLRKMANKVTSGDASNEEARAAKAYWKMLFGPAFNRDRDGGPPNPALNYGYAILRAGVARALIGSGMLPTFGIHHRNKYNAFCLADDIMEPFRPFVDQTVWALKKSRTDYHVMTPEIKQAILKVLSCDTLVRKQSSPLMVALTQTTASLARCFSGEHKNVIYPTFPKSKQASGKQSK